LAAIPSLASSPLKQELLQLALDRQALEETRLRCPTGRRAFIRPTRAAGLVAAA